MKEELTSKTLVNKMLNELLDRYENSVASRGGSDKNISIFIDNKRSKCFDCAFISPKSRFYSEESLTELMKYQNDGLLTIGYNNRDTINKITLNLDKAKCLYALLDREDPTKDNANIIDYLSSLKLNDPLKSFAKDEINYINTNYRFRKTYYDDFNQLKDIMKCLIGIYELDEEIMLRDFSVKYLGDSKKFEKIKTRVGRVIKDYDNTLDYQSMDTDQLLKSLNIVKNSTYVLLKNRLIFKLNNQIINLDDLGFEYSLSDKMIENLEILDSDIKTIITVENLTTFKSFNDNALIIYLAGFHNHTKKMLLEKLYKKFPKANYYHYSDIDVGGFRIFNHLCKSTGIDFQPLHMSIKELQSDDISLKPLTENDIKSLREMVDDERYLRFKETIKYMLENNIKLEQENLD